MATHTAEAVISATCDAPARASSGKKLMTSTIKTISTAKGIMATSGCGCCCFCSIPYYMVAGYKVYFPQKYVTPTVTARLPVCCPAMS